MHLAAFGPTLHYLRSLTPQRNNEKFKASDTCCNFKNTFGNELEIYYNIALWLL